MGLNAIDNEKYLLQRVSLGDQKAFELLFFGYEDQLSRYVFCLTHSKELTEEIIQDVFIKIWQNKDKLTTVEKFNAYLFVLTKNHVLNSIRKSVAELKQQQLYELASAGDVLDSSVNETIEMDEQLTILLEKAIHQLPPQQQKVFQLRNDGWKNPAIAQFMNISVDSVKKYQQLALKAVIAYIKSFDALSALIFVALNIEKSNMFDILS